MTDFEIKYLDSLNLHRFHVIFSRRINPEAFFINRDEVNDCEWFVKIYPELEIPGVYIIFNLKHNHTYVGQSYDCLTRLRQHEHDHQHAWRFAIIMVLNNAHQQINEDERKYLERNIYLWIKSYHSTQLTNGSIPEGTHGMVQDDWIADLNDFKRLLMVLRMPFFSFKKLGPAKRRYPDHYLSERDANNSVEIKNTDKSPFFYIRSVHPKKLSRVFKAKVYLDVYNHEWVITKGSKMAVDHSASFRPTSVCHYFGYYLRQKLVNRQGYFLRDLKVKCRCSGVSKLIEQAPSDGRLDLKNKNGDSLKLLQDRFPDKYGKVK